MTTTTTGEPSVTEPARTPTLELRLPVDVDEAPLGYDDYGGTLAVEVMLAGGGYANLILPVDGARAWAGELFAAVTVAHREATGDPHALTDLELAELGDPNSYEPASTLALAGTEAEPAQMRFVIALTIQGQVLHDADLRAAIVEDLTARFNTVHVAVSNGQSVAGERR
ncbi:MAG: hypothetical protein ACRD0D_12685 [Acidimicrobiales bacterium]